MADNGSEQTEWPMAKFHFQVEWDSLLMSFQEVSGLDMEPLPIDNNADDELQFSMIKTPSLPKLATISLKRGVVLSHHNFWDWFNQFKINTNLRRSLTISLFDENGTAMMVWSIENAWPDKISASELSLHGNEVAIESLEIAHEGLIISNG
jgi:phage tail-like protein